MGRLGGSRQPGPSGFVRCSMLPLEAVHTNYDNLDRQYGIPVFSGTPRRNAKPWVSDVSCPARAFTLKPRP